MDIFLSINGAEMHNCLFVQMYHSNNYKFGESWSIKLYNKPNFQSNDK